MNTPNGKKKRPLPATRAFILVSLLILALVVLLIPQATVSLVTILGTLPAFFYALSAFITTLRGNKGE